MTTELSCRPFYSTKTSVERPLITEKGSTHYSTHDPLLHYKIEMRKHKANCYKVQKLKERTHELLARQ